MKKKNDNKPRVAAVIVIFAVVICAAALSLGGPRADQRASMPEETYIAATAPTESPTAPTLPSPEPPTEPEPEPESEPVPEPWELFQPYSLPETDPANFRNFAFASQIEGSLYPIHFGMPQDYTNVIGITTFRGNNFRDNAAWGTADVVEERLVERYRINIGSLGRWTGVGWVGQPVIVQWDFEVQQMMSMMHPHMREREGLVEAIQAAMDGFIYFFCLETGEATRPRLNIGQPVKGGVTVDPRGYPLVYIGHGDNVSGGRFGYVIHSLIDGSELFFLNTATDPFALRRWGGFDGNPLFDSTNDRMVAVGENGVLYSMILNTVFDRDAETISIAPIISRYRHAGSRRLGTENSPAALGHYIFYADNAGWIQCIDLRTLEPVWVFDAGDDTDATLVLEWNEERQNLYIYTGSSVDFRGSGGLAYIRKLDARNGAVVWEYSLPCQTTSNVNGGVMATPALGQNDISHLVIFNVAKTIGRGGGSLIIAFDKETGEIVWETPMRNFGWSSPVAVYTDDGTSYIIVSDSAGNMYLIRGIDGEILHRINLGGNVEASPAVFGNMIVVGTRGQRIFGIEIS